jgi:hypothetical protein
LFGGTELFSGESYELCWVENASKWCRHVSTIACWLFWWLWCQKFWSKAGGEKTVGLAHVAAYRDIVGYEMPNEFNTAVDEAENLD